MKTFFTGLIFIFLLFSGCGKSEIVTLDLKGTLKGKINTIDEFGYENNDNAGIVIRLEGSEPLISSTTDNLGHYEINNIPSGTYNLILSKEGYAVNQKQGVQIIGGNMPLWFNGSIIEKSSIVIENLSLEVVNNSEIYLKGIVNHNYVINSWDFMKPVIRYFIHNADNPSDTNYLHTDNIIFSKESGSQLYYRLYFEKNQFPSGSKISIIAYGCNIYGYGYYDILSNQYRFPSLGKGSNIASITIP